MSEVKKIATRESYGNALVELGREHDRPCSIRCRFGRCNQDGNLQESISGTFLGLWNCRSKYGWNRSRTFYLR